LARAQAEAKSVSGALAKQFPVEDKGFIPGLTPLQTALFGDIRTPLLILLSAVGLVLLLVCVNIANLMLARSAARTRELALRQALGAGRGRIVRQLLTESAMLGFIGSTIGVAIAFFSARALALLLPKNLPATGGAQLDWRVLGFFLALSVAAIVAFGLVPAMLATDSNMQSYLKDSSARTGSTGGRTRIGRLLAAAEIGLATVIVVGAGLLVRSLLTMTAVSPGFIPDHILKAQISLPRYQYSTPQQWVAFSNALLERIQAQPGMQDSAIGIPAPLADPFAALPFSIPDHAPPPFGTPSIAHYVAASPGYFKLMGIPLVRGRWFERDDSESSHPVAAISESFARFYFNDENPVGKKLMFGFPPNSNVAREIVGVVGDVRDEGLSQEPAPMMYVPVAQGPIWGANLLVRSSSPPQAVVAAIHEVVLGLDKNLPVTEIVTMPEALDATVAQPKLHTWLLSSFGAVALLLAAIGVFGVVSYSVASRTREFGVRAALGASPASIQRMILSEGLLLGGIGAAVGLAASLGLGRFLKSELYHVTSYDPATLIISIGVLLVVAILACYIPARRAMSVDPMMALRHE
jgi:putative ABC transport system permease protein